MKNILIIICLILVSSCVREDNSTFCYSLINTTNRTIKLEFYAISGQSPEPLDSFEKTGRGVITKKCRADMGFADPATVYRSDSIIVRFDAMKKLTFTNSGVIEQLFISSFYQREEGTLNYTYEFTEEDFNNAVPY
jgi:hypothetical protein